jgi:hypothetical protein
MKVQGIEGGKRPLAIEAMVMGQPVRALILAPHMLNQVIIIVEYLLAMIARDRLGRTRRSDLLGRRALHGLGRNLGHLARIAGIYNAICDLWEGWIGTLRRVLRCARPADDQNDTRRGRATPRGNEKARKVEVRL